MSHPYKKFIRQIEEHLKARNSPEAQEGLRAFLEKRPPSWMTD